MLGSARKEIRNMSAPTEAEDMTLEALQKEYDLFRSLGARVITMNASMGNHNFNHQVVQQLGDSKYLDKDLLFSHSASFTESEFAPIRASSTPETDLQIGMGHPVAFKDAAHGCRVGLGIKHHQQSEQRLSGPHTPAAAG